MIPYNGGKQQGVGKKIAAAVRAHLIKKDLGHLRCYWEPFCGAGGVLQHMGGHFKVRLASDAHEDLVHFLEQLSDGRFVAPDTVDKIMFEALKARRNEDDVTEEMRALRAYVGTAYGFGGAYFTTFKKGKSKGVSSEDYDRRSRACMERAHKLTGTLFFRGDYRLVYKYVRVIKATGLVIYCDPPYKGVAKCGRRRKFDHDKFWDWVRLMVQYGHHVYVSERQAPDDFVSIFEKARRKAGANWRGSSHKKTCYFERVFVHKTQL